MQVARVAGVLVARAGALEQERGDVQAHVVGADHRDALVELEEGAAGVEQAVEDALDLVGERVLELGLAEQARSYYNDASALFAVLFGLPGFFEPRTPPAWIYPAMPSQSLSFYDTTPLRQTLLDLVDFDMINSKRIRFSVGAVNLRSGNFDYFDNAKQTIGPEHIMASSALPPGFPPVEIDGEFYWDGGFLGNPAIFPLIYNCDSRDVVIVHINPIQRAEVPKTAVEIMNRINEISFNSSLMREMRAISFVTKLIDGGQLDDKQFRLMRVHGIAADDVMCGLGVASKLNADWDFLTELRDVGRERAQAWLDAKFGDVGKNSTVDIAATYL